MAPRINKSDVEWRESLTREQYEVLRKKGTERPFTGELNANKDAGIYRCAGCGAELFRSDAKFDSGTGWPSFYEPADGAAVRTEDDRAFFMHRTEVLCASCEGHLGHVFEDGPQPTGPALLHQLGGARVQARVRQPMIARAWPALTS